MQAIKQKIVLSGDIVEYETMELPVFVGTNYHKKPNRGGTPLSSPEDNELKSAHRAKASVRRLVNANTRKWLKENGQPYLPIFITFTFKEDIRNLDQANELFTQFIQRLNYFVGKGDKKHLLQYIAITEFQDENRNGVIHYHVLFFNLRFIERVYDEIKRVWKWGNTNIKSVRNIRDLGRYLVKYMVKSMQDGRLKGRKKYFASHGLQRPRTLYDKDLVELIVEMIPKDCGLNTASWPNKFCKQITRTTFDVAKHPEALAWLYALVLK